MAKVKKTVKSSRKQSVKKPLLIKEKLKIPSQNGKSLRSAVVLLFLWLAFCAATITFPSYSWLFPNHEAWLPFHPSWGTALLLLGVMFLFIRVLANANQSVGEDISSFWAKIGVSAAVILAAVLCLYHMNKPFGAYADDCAYFVKVTRHLRDLADYSNAFIFERGLLPVWPYTALFFWHLLPADSGLAIQRLTGTFFDLGTILVLYLAGKEIAGRRMGLFAAAFASISRPLLTTTVTGYASTPLSFGMALVVWLTIRLIRKSTIFDFLLWGGSIGFIAYTAAPVEPFIPFFVFMGLGLTWWNNRKVMKVKDANFLIWLSLGIFLIYFLCCNNAFPKNEWILLKIKILSSWILAIILLCGIIFSRKTNSGSGESLWNKWFWGSWLATFLSFPSLTNGYLIERIEQHSMISGAGFLSPTYLWSSFHRLPDTIKWLFWTCQDRADMSLAGDPFFSYSETILIGLGLVFCFAKPDLKRIFLFLTATLGVVPHFIAGDNHHSGLLICCAIPFLLIGALGLNSLWEIMFSGISKIRFTNALTYLLLIAFWVWSAQGLFFRVYTQWSEKNDGLGLPREEALRDVTKGYRVYLSPQFFNGSPEFYEGSSIHYWHDFNPIDLAINEKIPDVVVYSYGEEAPIRKIISKFFPGAKLEGLSSPYMPGNPVAFRCEIPASTISMDKHSVLYVSRISGPFWTRSYIAGNNFFNLSMIDWEDKAVDVKSAPLEPNLYSTDRSMEMETVIHINHGGKHEFVCKTANRTKVLVDGKEVYDLFFPRLGTYMSPPVDRKVLLNLSEGDHKVEVVTCFQFSTDLPDITLRSADSTGTGQSLWKSFSFD